MKEDFIAVYHSPCFDLLSKQQKLQDYRNRLPILPTKASMYMFRR